MLTQFLLAGLLKVTGPVAAEKLLLSGYVVLFFMSFRYLLRALTPYADYFSCFAGIVVLNLFFFMGFWNFLYSVCLVLFTLGYYARRQGRWTPRSLAVLLFAGLVIYMAHALSWAMCVLAVAVMGLPHAISAVPWGRAHPLFPPPAAVRRAMLQYAASVCCLLPPGALIWMYLARSQKNSGLIADHPSLRERLYPLYSLSFLHTISDSDLTLAKAVAATLFLTFLFVAWTVFWRRRYSGGSTAILLLSLVCSAAVIAGPDRVGSGSYILNPA